MRVTKRDPKTPRRVKPVLEGSDQEPSLVVSTEKIVLGIFEVEHKSFSNNQKTTVSATL